MMKMIAITDVVEVNPRVPVELSADKSRVVDFVPMSQISEHGRVAPNGSRPLGEVIKGYNYFANGDVLVAKITPCMENGKAAFVDNLPHGVGFGSTEFHVLRPGPDVDGRYLFYMVWNPAFRHLAARNMTGSAGQKRVPRRFFERFKIPLPPLSEQKRIADILDKADAIRRKRHEALDDLNDYPHSLFQEMFGHPDQNPKGWPVMPFEEIADSRLGKMLDAKQQTGKNPRPYMRNLNVAWGRIDLREIFEMDFDAQARQEFRLKYGDVLICEGGAGVGQTAIWRDDIPECYFQKSLHRVRPYPDKAIPEFIAFLMWTLMKGSSLLRSISSATIPHLTGVNLKKVMMSTPPIGLQREFQQQITKYDAARTSFQKSAVCIDDLFNSLVQRAFRGEL